MNPNPFASLNHFTVPVAMMMFSFCLRRCRLSRSRPRGPAQLLQRLGFDLANALAGHRELLADLPQRMIASFSNSEAQLDDFGLARGQPGKQGLRLAGAVAFENDVERRDRVFVAKEVSD